MRVLHITTTVKGGAGIAAVRLHEALLKAGVESRILTLYGADNGKSDLIETFRDTPRTSRLRSLLKGLLFRVGIPTTKSQKHNLAIAGLNGEYATFTCPRTDYDVSRHRLIEWCDIIHLHWVANFIDYESFFKNINKPVAWTLHDAGPILGGFHIAYDVEANQQQFGKLEEAYRKIKRDAVSGYPALQVIAPSGWLLQDSKNSEVFRGRPHRQIHNCLDSGEFLPVEKNVARKALGLEQQSVYILLMAHSINNYNKGIDLLEKAIGSGKLDRKVRFMVVGQSAITHPSVDNFGYIEDGRILSLLHSASDAICISSRSENMPNVMVEAMYCGKPVLGFEIGGLKEMVKDGFNGLLSSSVSAEGLINIINRFVAIKDTFSPEEIRKYAVSEFSYDTITDQHIEVYRKILFPAPVEKNSGRILPEEAISI